MSKNGWKALVRDRDGNCCKICGSCYKLTVHHKIPVSRGGKSNLYNCVCWCWECHKAYHNKWGLTTSDDYGNPVGQHYGMHSSSKKKKKKRRKRK